MVEGIELHNVSKSRGLMLYLQQKATFYPSLKARRINLSGVRDLGTSHMDMVRQLGRPYRSFLLIEEYGVQAIISKETKCRCRESDSSVVPMKLGNADGGKAATRLSPLLVTHLLHTEVEIINGN
ncbi:hypothetical protein PB01_02805 [Psychrobacillus glaciei]|uniref:Uncharacterized protein n=1 Tax=Psychrobacillus glaciei TaxID=2283160 RepID=A0A5J6SNU6_9BACI|nr:hypothetical protein PB01_02805 [Psychrobacillus glaciei]